MFFDLINKSEQIPEQLKRRANELNKFIDNNTTESIKRMIEIKKSVKKSLVNYKTFRTILMYMDCYMNDTEISKTTLLPDNKKIQRQVEIETIDYDREEKEEFLTEEEIERIKM